jgi:ArsR family transcriptional regulator, arsenate/arsenite/antimonite-responsive transcriptional repressor
MIRDTLLHPLRGGQADTRTQGVEDDGGRDAALAALAKAVAHPVRSQIVRLLAAQETCMYGDLSERLPLAKSTVSQHLKILREAGLVRVETDGPWVCYCIDPAGLARLKVLVAEL